MKKPKAKRSRPEESAFSSEMSKSAECETEPATAANDTPPNELGRTNNDPPQNHPPTNDLPPVNPPSFVDKCAQTKALGKILSTWKKPRPNLKTNKNSREKYLWMMYSKATSLCIFTLDCLHMHVL